MKRENASIYWGIFLFTAENKGGTRGWAED